MKKALLLSLCPSINELHAHTPDTRQQQGLHNMRIDSRKDKEPQHRIPNTLAPPVLLTSQSRSSGARAAQTGTETTALTARVSDSAPTTLSLNQAASFAPADCTPLVSHARFRRWEQLQETDLTLNLRCFAGRASAAGWQRSGRWDGDPNGRNGEVAGVLTKECVPGDNKRMQWCGPTDSGDVKQKSESC